MGPYNGFFYQATEHEPYPYQAQLGEDEPPVVLDVQTGLGKTEATVLSWLYRRFTKPESTPRRLMYCLPMRSLVEQTRDRVSQWFDNLRISSDVPDIEVVMGGDVGEKWFRAPERACVVIGTQDMLLSRALNRGYAMSRFQWPMTFAAANDDVYWVLDEVQLQGIGAVTATQLQAFRERFGTYHPTQLTLASATIDTSWFETGDFSLNGRRAISLSNDDFEHAGIRRVIFADKRIERAYAAEPKDIALLARERHRAGTRTLVIVNRVGRAQETYRHLRRIAPDEDVVLLHSRFRPHDRNALTAKLLASVDSRGPGRIVVATQVVEAGIDVTAATLITDVAPWASLVQRFGRCNRRGDETGSRCIWLDRGRQGMLDTQPYDAQDVIAAYELLRQLEGASAAPAHLSKNDIPLRTGLVIRKPEFMDLFDTSADLSGHDVDVSPYIRDVDDVTVSLFWRHEPPTSRDLPQRDELCSAPLTAARELLQELRKGGHALDARIANQFASDPDQAWVRLRENDLRPGLTVWLRSDVGWYDSELGFGKIQQLVEPAARTLSTELYENCPTTDSDILSELGVPITLARHARDTQRQARALTAALMLPPTAADIAVTAALWHDVGKAHYAFQDTMRRANEGVGNGHVVWAKGVRHAQHARRGFRHELPGALAYLFAHDKEPYADAIAYLIAAHHGKLRVAAQQLPYEASCEPFQLLGTVDGETLPQTDLGGGFLTEPVTLSLDSFKVGSQNGEPLWVDRTISLRDHGDFGPVRLAYLELVVRLADWRASEEEAKCQ